MRYYNTAMSSVLRKSQKQRPSRLGTEHIRDKPKGSSNRTRCDAFLKTIFTVAPDGACKSKHPRCRSWAMTGKSRCRMHGGASTGPKTPEGKARAIAAMMQGRRQWVLRMGAEGNKFPCGRKPKFGNSMPEFAVQQLTEPSN